MRKYLFEVKVKDFCSTFDGGRKPAITRKKKTITANSVAEAREKLFHLMSLQGYDYTAKMIASEKEKGMQKCVYCNGPLTSGDTNDVCKACRKSEAQQEDLRYPDPDGVLEEGTSNKYRKKPVVIEARQLTKENCEEIAEWVLGKMSEYDKAKTRQSIDNFGGLGIVTLEGVMLAKIGDYVIKGVNGEFYPCKADIFEKTYDKV